MRIALYFPPLSVSRRAEGGLWTDEKRSGAGRRKGEEGRGRAALSSHSNFFRTNREGEGGGGDEESLLVRLGEGRKEEKGKERKILKFPFS